MFQKYFWLGFAAVIHCFCEQPPRLGRFKKYPIVWVFVKLPAMPTVLRFDAYRVAIYTNVIAPHTFTSSDRKGGPFSS